MCHSLSISASAIISYKPSDFFSDLKVHFAGLNILLSEGETSKVLTFEIVEPATGAGSFLTTSLSTFFFSAGTSEVIFFSSALTMSAVFDLDFFPSASPVELFANNSKSTSVGGRHLSSLHVMKFR